MYFQPRKVGFLSLQESKQFGSDVDRKKNFIDDSKGADSSGLKLGSAKVSNLRLEDASGQGLNTSSKSKRPALLGSPEGKADMPLKQPATPTASPSKPAFRRNRMLVGNTIKQKPRNPSVGPASAPSAPVYFNLLCLGKDGVGKSSFLKDFIEKVFDKKQVVDRFEKKLVEYVTERKWIDGKRRFVVNLIDSQGYCDEYLVDRWMDDTKKYVYKKVIYLVNARWRPTGNSKPVPVHPLRRRTIMWSIQGSICASTSLILNLDST